MADEVIIRVSAETGDAEQAVARVRGGLAALQSQTAQSAAVTAGAAGSVQTLQRAFVRTSFAATRFAADMGSGAHATIALTRALAGTMIALGAGWVAALGAAALALSALGARLADVHGSARKAREALEEFRKSIATPLGLPKELVPVTTELQRINAELARATAKLDALRAGRPAGVGGFALGPEDQRLLAELSLQRRIADAEERRNKLRGELNQTLELARNRAVAEAVVAIDATKRWADVLGLGPAERWKEIESTIERALGNLRDLQTATDDTRAQLLAAQLREARQQAEAAAEAQARFRRELEESERKARELEAAMRRAEIAAGLGRFRAPEPAPPQQRLAPEDVQRLGVARFGLTGGEMVAVGEQARVHAAAAQAAAAAGDIVNRASTAMVEVRDTVAAGFGAMLAAAVTGTNKVQSVVVGFFGALAQAAQQILRGPVGGPIGALLGGFLGALGGLFGGRRRPVPVRVVEPIELRRPQQEQNVVVQIVSASTGEILEEFLVEAERLRNRGGHVRIPRPLVSVIARGG